VRVAVPVLVCLVYGLGASSCSAPNASPAGEPAGAAVPGGAGTVSRPARMLRVAARLTDGGLEVVSLVEAQNTVNRRDPLRRSPAFWRSYDGQGRLLEERGFRLETGLRSEHPGPHGELGGQQVPLDEPVFDVAVPLSFGLASVRFFRVAPGGDRERAEILGELEIPGGPAP